VLDALRSHITKKKYQSVVFPFSVNAYTTGPAKATMAFIGYSRYGSLRSWRSCERNFFRVLFALRALCGQDCPRSSDALQKDVH
jgi:hypothetical protein